MEHGLGGHFLGIPTINPNYEDVLHVGNYLFFVQLDDHIHFFCEKIIVEGRDRGYNNFRVEKLMLVSLRHDQKAEVDIEFDEMGRFEVHFFSKK